MRQLRIYLGVTIFLLLVTTVSAQASQYYLYINGQNIGPITPEAAFQTSGFDLNTTMVAVVGSSSWVPAKDVPEFMALAPKPPEPTETNEENDESEDDTGSSFSLKGAVAVIVVGLILILRVVSVIAWLWVVVLAFGDSMGWGFLCLCCAPGNLIYCLMNFDKAKWPFIIQAVCWVVVIILSVIAEVLTLDSGLV